MISLNVLDYESVDIFIAALDGFLSMVAKDLAECMSLGIAHEDHYQQALQIFLIRTMYEYNEFDVSNIIVNSARVTIPITADMTYIFSDAISI
jgi:hypothetical protein